MKRAPLVLLCIAAWVWIAARPAHAQVGVPEPPGPFVFDVRGAMSGVPTSAPFYPILQEDLAVPSRAFGLEAGAHVYLFSLGRSRIGLGASYTHARSTATGLAATVRLLAPQLSFNFGTENGWSHLSAGLGTASIETEVSGLADPTEESGRVRALNFGGGARWFLTRHAAVGFDVRFHRLAEGPSRPGRPATPSVVLVVISAGLSIK